MDMKRKMRILSGLLLFFCGVLCFLSPNFHEWKIQRDVDRLIDDFDGPEDKRELQQEPQNDQENEEEKKKTAFGEELYVKMQEYNERLTEEGQNIVDAWSYEQPCIDLSVLPGGDYTFGYIEIPDMEVQLPLLLGASRENLAQGAAVLARTSLPIGGENTNCVIAAHRGWKGSAFFQHIEKMEKGSFVYITNPWETLVYRTIDIRIIDPHDVESILIQEGKDMVTLLTCHPYMSGGKYRYLVYCERVDAEEESRHTEELGEKEAGKVREDETKKKGTGRVREDEMKKTEESRMREDGTKEKEESNVREDKEEIQEGEGCAVFYVDLIEVEEYIRIAMPLLTLLLSFLVIYFRYFK